MVINLFKSELLIVDPKEIEGEDLSSSKNGWFCARILPHKEAFALDNLVKNGFTVYCPRYQKWISSARKKQLVSRPLFPGYLFIQHAENVGFLGIVRRSPGISTIVGVQNSFSVVPDTVIMNIKRGENQSGFIEINHNRFKKGDKIKLNDERFLDMDAIFEEQDDLRRSIILFKFLGKTHRVKVLTNSLEFV